MDLDADSILLTDRVALVTGAGSGIGAATARLLAACGAAVALCDRCPEALAEVVKSVESVEATAAGPGGAGGATRPGMDGVAGGTVQAAVLSQVLDVREPEAVDSFVATVGERFGRVDVLVNNAGGTFVAPVLDVSPKGEAMLVAENFTQVLHLVRQVVPLMPAGGSIVNVTSVEAHQAAPGFAVYAAMKAAVANLTRSLALELAPRGIRVNAMAPDGLASAGEGAARDELQAAGGDYRAATLPPLGHLGTGEDGAAAILFLAGNLSRYVTGTTIHVDGGTWAAGGWQRLPPD